MYMKYLCCSAIPHRTPGWKTTAVIAAVLKHAQTMESTSTWQTMPKKKEFKNGIPNLTPPGNSILKGGDAYIAYKIQNHALLACCSSFAWWKWKPGAKWTRSLLESLESKLNAAPVLRNGTIVMFMFRPHRPCATADPTQAAAGVGIFSQMPHKDYKFWAPNFARKTNGYITLP